VCGGAGVANQCGVPSCTRITSCPSGMNCGSVADGCGGTVTCGTTCPQGQICGGGGLANVCGGGSVAGDGGPGSTCQPITTCPLNFCGPIADGCGGVIQCGNCPSPEVCGANGVASQCGGSNQCTQTPQATACAGFTCGFQPDGCGGLWSCGSCPTGESCGLFAANQCASPSGPCIPTGNTATCAKNSDCCSGVCSNYYCTAPEAPAAPAEPPASLALPVPAA